MWLIILIILVLLFVIFLTVNIIFNKFQDYIIKINEVEGKIDETLRNKYDSIVKANNIIKEKIKTDKEILDDIDTYKDKKVSSFDMHRMLTEDYNKIDYIKNQYKEVSTNEDIKAIFNDISDMDESLNAYIKYYNENITTYNKYVRKFPFNIIAVVLHYKEKKFFDGKDLNDKNEKDFKL